MSVNQLRQKRNIIILVKVGFIAGLLNKAALDKPACECTLWSGRESAGAINYISNGCTPFVLDYSKALMLCIMAHCDDLKSGTKLNRAIIYGISYNCAVCAAKMAI